MNNIYITGGTGFLGSHLIKEILSTTNDNIVALVRARDNIEANFRLISVLREISSEKFVELHKNRIEALQGDITKKHMGMSDEDMKGLIDKVDILYHCAANTELNLQLAAVKKVNVAGTKNVLECCALCKKRGHLKKVNHISTAFIAGTHKGTFKERDLDVGQRFNNTYEESKFDGEKTVNKFRADGLDIDIYRPGIILGRYSDGMTTKLKMLYQPLRFLAMELIKKIPVSDNNKAYLLNVDVTAKAIHSIANATKGENKNYHIIYPNNKTSHYILRIASDYFGFPAPKMVNRESFNWEKEFTPAQRMMIAPYLPYFNCKIRFAVDNSISKLKDSSFKYPEFDEENLKRLFAYCHKVGFIKKRSKNVTVK